MALTGLGLLANGLHGADREQQVLVLFLGWTEVALLALGATCIRGPSLAAPLHSYGLVVRIAGPALLCRNSSPFTSVFKPPFYLANLATVLCALGWTPGRRQSLRQPDWQVFVWLSLGAVLLSLHDPIPYEGIRVYNFILAACILRVAITWLLQKRLASHWLHAPAVGWLYYHHHSTGRAHSGWYCEPACLGTQPAVAAWPFRCCGRIHQPSRRHHSDCASSA